MKNLEILVQGIYARLDDESFSRDDVIKMKRAWAKDEAQVNVPTNIEVLKTYKQMVSVGTLQEDARVSQLLRKRSIRSQSGIVAVQVLTKPFWCPGKCIFCPNDATMPKSYINTQPGAMRALLNNFDPYKQVYNRLLSLMLTGHSTDKIEMIVLGGTWDVYPQKYKIEFIKGLYDACNSFDSFLEQIEIDYTNPKAARYTETEGIAIDYPEKIADSIVINETAKNRIIGLTIETRPEYVTHENCKFRRELGVTRMEMGIQTLHNSVHDLNKRGHTNKEIVEAMHMLRQYGFKISNHYMPGLYGSTPEMDIETFRMAYENPAIKSDEMKFYPTAVIPNTPLYDLYKSGKYEPIDPEQLEKIIRKAKLEIIPPYARIKRLARDFDTNEVVAGANTPNLRQLTMNAIQKEFDADEKLREKQYDRLFSDMKYSESLDSILPELIDFGFEATVPTKNTSTDGWEYDVDDVLKTRVIGNSVDCKLQRAFVCLCTRCREMRHDKNTNQGELSLSLVLRGYHTTNGLEVFCSYEDSFGYLHGFARLLLPKPGSTVEREGLGSGVALIRELHVYGTVQGLENIAVADSTAQHGGLGTQLLNAAQVISKEFGFDSLSVISGVGVRSYYEKKGFHREGTYMIKTLK